jgi:hypothetical protein
LRVHPRCAVLSFFAILPASGHACNKRPAAALGRRKAKRQTQAALECGGRSEFPLGEPTFGSIQLLILLMLITSYYDIRSVETRPISNIAVGCRPGELKLVFYASEQDLLDFLPTYD